MSLRHALKVQLPIEEILQIYINKKTPLSDVYSKCLKISICKYPTLWARAIHDNGTLEDYNIVKTYARLDSLHKKILFSSGISIVPLCYIYGVKVGFASYIFTVFLASYNFDMKSENLRNCANQIEFLREQKKEIEEKLE